MEVSIPDKAMMVKIKDLIIFKPVFGEMKLRFKNKLLIGLLIAFLISSCSHKTKNAEFDSKLLEGEWTTGKNTCENIGFEDGKFYDLENIFGQSSYKISTDSLIISNNEEINKIFKILKLTEDSLTLKLIFPDRLIKQNIIGIKESKETTFRKLTEREVYELYLNSVKGHLEKDTIIGNFTGLGIDTLYVCTVENFPEVSKDDLEPGSLEYYTEYQHFYARSNNPAIPDVEIFGMPYGAPQLVYEGDLDGDGLDEWGYLHTWMNSQWRQYRVYNYDSRKKEWRHLYYDTPYDPEKPQILHTPFYLRASGKDIVEKGPEPGLIKIHYGKYDGAVYDTIVKPNYVPITKDTW